MLFLTKSFKYLRIPLVIFLIIFIAYLSNLPTDYKRDLKNHRTRRMLVSDDLVPNTFLPYLIIKENTLKLNNIMKYLKPLFQDGADTPYYAINVNGNYYSAYPILTGIMAIPVYIVPILLNKIPGLDLHLNILKVLFLGRVAAAFYAALSCSLMYMILRKISNSGIWIYIFTFFYAFGTTTWTISSRGLWMHTTSQLILSIAILLFLYAMKNPKFVKWIGLILGIAVLIRPTNIVIAVVMSIYVFLNHRKEFKSFVLFALPTIVLYFLYNYLIFGSPLIEGYAARNDHNWSTPLLTSIPAFLFSPDRSFLFLSPPLVLSYYGIVKILVKKRKIKTKTEVLLTYLGISFILSFLMISKWWAWSGASGFGYRMLTEYLPIVTMFAFLVSDKFSKIGKTIIVALMLYSFYIHFNATIFRKSRCSSDHLWSMYCLMPPKSKPQY